MFRRLDVRPGRLRTPANLAGYPKGPASTSQQGAALNNSTGPQAPTPQRPIGANARTRPPRVSPWAMIRRPYRAHGYPGRPDGPTSTNQRGAAPNKPTSNGPQGPNGWTPGMIIRPVPGRPGGAYSIRPYTGTIIRAIGPPRGTVIRAREARPVGRMQYAPTRVPA